jgi:AcrR family transcriptional regulator
MEREPSRRPGGRSARVRNSVLDATIELLAEQGDLLTIPQVAARAGVHETSIYRRWGTREALIADAVMSRMADEIPIPDTGNLRDDLRAFVARSRGLLTSPLGRQFLKSVAIAPRSAETDPRLHYWPRRLEVVAGIFERAIARGELRGDLDVGLATEMVIAPIYFRLLISHAPVDDEFEQRLVDFMVASLEGG